MSIPPYIWYPVLASLGLGFTFMNIPPVADQFMTLFGVGHAGLGLFLSGLYWSHFLSQVPAGIVVDRLGVFRSFLLSFAVTLVVNLIPLLAPDSLMLAIVMRFFLGLAASVMFLSIVKTVSALAPPHKLARAQGIQGASFSLGTMVPYCTLPYMGANAWVYSYLLVAGFAVVATICLFFMPRAELAAARVRTSPQQIWTALKSIPRNKGIWILGCFHGLAYGSFNNLGNWFPSILVDLAPSTTIESWALVASAILLTGTAARAFGGEILRFFTRTQVVGGVVLILSVIHLLSGLSSNPTIVIALGIAMALTAGASYGSIFTLTMGAVAPAYIATAVGFMNMIANLVNVTMIILFGSIRDMTGHFTPTFFILSAFGFTIWFLGRSVRFTEHTPPPPKS